MCRWAFRFSFRQGGSLRTPRPVDSTVGLRLRMFDRICEIEIYSGSFYFLQSLRSLIILFQFELILHLFEKVDANRWSRDSATQHSQSHIFYEIQHSNNTKSEETEWYECAAPTQSSDAVTESNDVARFWPLAQSWMHEGRILCLLFTGKLFLASFYWKPIRTKNSAHITVRSMS